MNSERSFYIRELARELAIPYGMVYKEIKNLADLGIISEQKKGKITLISANKTLPYFSELRGLITKTTGLADLLRAALSQLNGIKYALIYGSFASGEERQESDVDTLIIGEVDEGKVLEVTHEIEKRTLREINYILWTEEEFAKRTKAKHHLLMGIITKPTIMLVGDENELRGFIEKWSHT
jgi:predicted nucleotidyltransferase